MDIFRIQIFFPFHDLQIMLGGMIPHECYCWWARLNRIFQHNQYYNIYVITVLQNEIKVTFWFNCPCEYTTLISGRSPSVRPAARPKNISLNFISMLNVVYILPTLLLVSVDWLIYIFIPWEVGNTYSSFAGKHILKGTLRYLQSIFCVVKICPLKPWKQKNNL